MPYYTVSHHRAPKLTTEQQHLKQALVDTGEEWSTTWQSILARDPHYFAAYVKLRSVPITRTGGLSRKVQELIMLAIDASCTSLFEPGVRAHLAAALRAGATTAEIMDVLELTSVLGLHAVNVGVPLLQEVLEEKGQWQTVGGHNLSESQQQIRTSLQQRSDGDGGFWARSSDALFALSPALMEAGTEFTAVPFQREAGGARHLDSITMELIYVAIDCATTYIRHPALKTHIRNALDCGATVEQIMNVFELAALRGVQSVMVGADLLGDGSTK